MIIIPELRELVKTSRDFIDGKVGIAELNGYVAQCQKISIVMGLDEQIQLLLLDYVDKVGQTWDEWGLLKDPMTEGELKSWIKNEFLDDQDENYKKFKEGT